MYLSSFMLALFAMTSFYLAFLIYKAAVGAEKYPIILWVGINIATLVAYLISASFSVGFAYGLGFVCQFCTILYGLVAPLVSLLLPDEAKNFAIISPFVSLPFAMTGLFLHIFSIYTCWFFVGYFAIPSLIGTCWLLGISLCEKMKRKEIIENELV